MSTGARQPVWTMIHGNRQPGPTSCAYDVWTCTECSDVHLAVMVPVEDIQLRIRHGATQVAFSRAEAEALIEVLQKQLERH